MTTTMRMGSQGTSGSGGATHRGREDELWICGAVDGNAVVNAHAVASCVELWKHCLVLGAHANVDHESWVDPPRVRH